MDITWLAVFWTFFFSWFVFRRIYAKAILPYAIDRARFRLFALRDELRRIEQEKKPKNLRPYLFMEDVLNTSTRRVHTISIGALIRMKPNPKVIKKIEKAVAEFRNAAPELRKIDERYTRTMHAIAAVRSPFLLVYVTLLLLFFRVTKRTTTITELKKRKEVILHCPHASAEAFKAAA